MLERMSVLCFCLCVCVCLSMWGGGVLFLFCFFFPITAGGVDSGDRGYTSIKHLEFNRSELGR